MNLPTQEELEKAQKYEDKVPNYQVSSGNGQIHSGIIIDSPNYPNYMGQPSDQQPAPVEVFKIIINHLYHHYQLKIIKIFKLI